MKSGEISALCLQGSLKEVGFAERLAASILY
ncbi:hypothetical protein CYB_1476 [Synechococcus sp. JA-2-3B'a(2-13)]|nr:hypothetical protein CYB_1476 [Synechococcus sp. JA-2-3B'a(2-13)]